jgi:hypothetical protein
MNTASIPYGIAYLKREHRCYHRRIEKLEPYGKIFDFFDTWLKLQG